MVTMPVRNTIVDRDTIRGAYERIRPYVRRTPVIETNGADFGLDVSGLVLKLESLQHSGSFKARGAFTNLLLREVPPAGVVAASGGNHGAAVAFAAMTLNKPAKIFVPTVISPAKLDRIKQYRADVVVTGDMYADALAASEKWIAQSHAMSIHAYDQIETLWGAGTLGLEFEEQVPDLDTLLVAVGGGGLIGGVASWYAGRAKVVGIEPEASPTLHMALEAGRPVDAPAGGIASDSLAPKRVGEINLAIAQKNVDRVVLVPDDEIRRAQNALWSTLRMVVEAGGAAAFAALLSGRYVPRQGERVGVVLCGGNTDAVDFENKLRH
jgi:threonine dehydratase